MKKKSKKWVLGVCGLAAGALLALGCTGCDAVAHEPPVSIVSIDKTGSNGLQDIYTISYSNGTTSVFMVTNGKDGKDNTTAPVSIASIEKTDNEGLVDIYTIYFTDGSETTFEVTNGEDGEDNTTAPVSIASIEKTDSDGLVDIYTIYFTDGSETTFEVTNGEDGADGASGAESYTAVNEALYSVGKLFCEFTELNTETTDDTEDTKLAIYTGGCVVYAMDENYTYLLTNYHVVHDEKSVGSLISEKIHLYLYGSEGAPSKGTGESGETVATYDSYAIACEYVGGAVTYDLAIVRARTEDVKKINGNVKPVSFASSYFVGESVVAIGNPQGRGISVTKGIVCVHDEYISLSIDGTARNYRSIRVDAAVYGGNSGGGLFNADGELIGLINAATTDVENINYAIPLPIVKNVAENIMRHHTDGDDSTSGVYKIILGVTTNSQNARYEYDEVAGHGKIYDDMLVTGVTAGGLAETLGVQKDDVLTGITIDGAYYAFDRYFDLTDYSLYLTAGVTFRLHYTRSGEAYETAETTVTKETSVSVA